MKHMKRHWQVFVCPIMPDTFTCCHNRDKEVQNTDREAPRCKKLKRKPVWHREWKEEMAMTARTRQKSESGNRKHHAFAILVYSFFLIGLSLLLLGGGNVVALIGFGQ